MPTHAKLFPPPLPKPRLRRIQQARRPVLVQAVLRGPQDHTDLGAPETQALSSGWRILEANGESFLVCLHTGARYQMIVSRHTGKTYFLSTKTLESSYDDPRLLGKLAMRSIETDAKKSTMWDHLTSKKPAVLRRLELGRPARQLPAWKQRLMHERKICKAQRRRSAIADAKLRALKHRNEHAGAVSQHSIGMLQQVTTKAAATFVTKAMLADKAVQTRLQATVSAAASHAAHAKNIATTQKLRFELVLRTQKTNLAIKANGAALRVERARAVQSARASCQADRRAEVAAANQAKLDSLREHCHKRMAAADSKRAELRETRLAALSAHFASARQVRRNKGSSRVLALKPKPDANQEDSSWCFLSMTSAATSAVSSALQAPLAAAEYANVGAEEADWDVIDGEGNSEKVMPVPAGLWMDVQMWTVDSSSKKSAVQLRLEAQQHVAPRTDTRCLVHRRHVALSADERGLQNENAVPCAKSAALRATTAASHNRHVLNTVAEVKHRRRDAKFELLMESLAKETQACQRQDEAKRHKYISVRCDNQLAVLTGKAVKAQGFIAELARCRKMHERQRNAMHRRTMCLIAKSQKAYDSWSWRFHLPSTAEVTCIPRPCDGNRRLSLVCPRYQDLEQEDTAVSAWGQQDSFPLSISV